MLKESVLFGELKKFKIPSGGDYSIFPKSKQDAKVKWGNAFSVYIKDMVCTTPPTVTDPSKTPDTSGCGPAFTSTLQLPTSATAASAAQDFSDAWLASMNALILLPGGGYSSPAELILSITPLTAFISAQYPLLKANLLQIFTSGGDSPAADAQVKKIAKAFHDATSKSGGPTACIYKNIAPIPPTLPGTLIYE